MEENYRDSQEALSKRTALMEESIRRHRLASRALIGLAAFIFLYFLATLFAQAVRPPTKESIALLVLIGLIVAVPLMSKFDISKDGGGIVFSDPNEMYDKYEARAEAARVESFEQTRLQIGALSTKLNEMEGAIAGAIANRTDFEDKSSPALEGELSPEQTPPSGEILEQSNTEGAVIEEASSETKEPGLRSIRKLLSPITVEDDPQKNRFGGFASTGDRVLQARVTPSKLGRKWFNIDIVVSSTDGSPLRGSSAYFFMHDTFEPDVYKVKFPRDSKSVNLKTTSMGAFTVGVAVDRGETLLELDLASSAVDAPKAFKEN